MRTWRDFTQTLLLRARCTHSPLLYEGTSKSISKCRNGLASRAAHAVARADPIGGARGERGGRTRLGVDLGDDAIGGDALGLEDQRGRGRLAEAVDAEELVGVLVPGRRDARLDGGGDGLVGQDLGLVGIILLLEKLHAH